MSRLLLLLLPFFIIFRVQAQSILDYPIKGAIYDNGSKEPLPYANIYLKKSNLGTITNSKGEFEINPQRPIYLSDSLTISFVGYETVTVAIPQKGTSQKIYLPSNAVQINEVVIKSLTATTIINRALQNIPQNYYQTPFISEGFYRVSSKKNENYVHLSEAVFGLYRNPEVPGKNQFKLDKLRALKDEKASHGIDLGLKGKSIFNMDAIYHLDQLPFLDKKGMRVHQFKLVRMTKFQGYEAYVIEFDKKERDKKEGFAGQLIIDKENYTFLQINYGFSPKGPESIKYGNVAEKVLMKLFDIHIEIERNDYQISYQKRGGKWCLSHVGNDVLLSFKSSRSHYDFKANTRVDYMVTSITTQDIEPFSKEEILGQQKFIENQTSEFDPDFWKNYNIILPDADFEKIANQLIAINKANDFKEEVEDMVRKLPKEHALRVDSILSFYHQQGLFNGNALIEYQGSVILNKSFSYKKTALDSNSTFRIGSTSKTFTAALIGLLEQNGQLSLSDTIGKYLPKYRHGEITVEQLLSHQSGIPDYLERVDYSSEILTEKYSLDTLIEKFCSDSLSFTPGSQFDYSNSGFVLLAAVIEKVTGQSFGVVLNEKILNPLGMENTYFKDASSTAVEIQGYLYEQPEPAYWLPNVIGAGGVISNVSDLLKWSRGIEDSSLFEAGFFQGLTTPRTSYVDWDAFYGLGWMIDQSYFRASKKHDLFYHPGTDLGFETMFLKQPDEQITVILLNHTGSFPRFEMTELILNELN